MYRCEYAAVHFFVIIDKSFDYSKRGKEMTIEDAYKYYEENFPMSMSVKEVSDKIEMLGKMDRIDIIRDIFCDNLLYPIAGGFLKYENDYFRKSELVSIFKHHAQKLPEDFYYFKAIYYYFWKNNEKSMEYLKKAIKKKLTGNDAVIDEITIRDWFLDPFKQGFSGFWEQIIKEISKLNYQDGILKYCELLDKFYKLKTNDEIVDELCLFIQKYPDFVGPKELLASVYLDMGMWKNVIACLETIDEPVIFVPVDIYSMMAWAYGKCKEYKNEEEYYRKCLELVPNLGYTKNNLAIN